MRKLGRLAATAALTCLIPAAAGAQQVNLDAYASRLAVYRSGDFATALRASMALPFDRLRDQAEEFARGLPGGAPGVELDLLAAAMIHFDLAWAAEMEPERNEEIARGFLNRVGGARRDASGCATRIWASSESTWTRAGSTTRCGWARFLREEYPDLTWRCASTWRASRSSSAGGSTTNGSWTRPRRATKTSWTKARGTSRNCVFGSPISRCARATRKRPSGVSTRPETP